MRSFSARFSVLIIAAGLVTTLCDARAAAMRHFDLLTANHDPTARCTSGHLCLLGWAHSPRGDTAVHAQHMQRATASMGTARRRDTAAAAAAGRNTTTRVRSFSAPCFCARDRGRALSPGCVMLLLLQRSI